MTTPKPRKLSHHEILEQRHTPDEMKRIQRFPIRLFLHNIRSMHNTGSIFRTADAAALRGIDITGYTAVPPRPEINKTALGATDTVPWTFTQDPLVRLDKLRQNGFRIVALEQTTDSIDIESLALDERPISMMIGNEIFGLDDELVECADDRIEIPMHGMKHSLNASVAAGIAVYSLIRRMNKSLD